MDGRYQIKHEVNGINFQVMPRQFAFNHEIPISKKPFQCAICSATFEETNSLKLHFSAVHQRGPPIPVDVLLNQKPSVVQQKPQTAVRKQNYFQKTKEINRKGLQYFCSKVKLSTNFKTKEVRLSNKFA